jgi:hypothetical protein
MMRQSVGQRGGGVFDRVAGRVSTVLLWFPAAVSGATLLAPAELVAAPVVKLAGEIETAVRQAYLR